MTKTDTDVRVELVKTNKSLLSTTEVSNGCVYFVEDTKELFFDFDSKRSEVKDILVLQKEAERTSILFAPLNKFYFVLETQTLWFYKDGTWYQVSQDLTNYYTKEELNNLINKFLQYVSITYADLVALKNASKLVEGTYYKIIDYVTTTNGNSATRSEPSRSAGHQFDIVVRATSKSTLSELASASLHEGDTYFATQNVGAWQIWYDIDNNVSKYDWAVTDGTGKGVIYRMIDEFQNDLPYDFKNIQFYRDKTLDKYKAGAKYFSADDSYYYTFWDSKNKRDLSIQTGYVCNYNKIGINQLADANSGKGDFVLNNNVFMTNNVIENTTISTTCYSNTISGEIRNNTFGSNCYKNILLCDGVFQDNQLGLLFVNNTTGAIIKYIRSTHFGAESQNNIFDGVTIQANTFGYKTVGNIFKDIFVQNIASLGFNGNTFNGRVISNTFDLFFRNNIINGALSYSTFGKSNLNNNIGPYTVTINTGDNVRYLTTPTNGTSTSRPSIQNLTIQSGIAGISSAPLDLTNIPNAPLGKSYNKEIRYGSGGQVQVIWTSPEGITKGYYKDSASATEWKNLNPTMSVDTWDE